MTYPTQRFLIRYLRTAVLGALLCLTAYAAPEAKKNFNLPAGEAVNTLKQFSEASGRETLFAAATVRGVQTKAVQGEFTASDALSRMLDGTGLMVVQDEKTGALAIKRDPDPNASRVAVEKISHPGQSTQTNPNSTDETVTLASFKVTATRRLEPLQKVPVAVSVLDGDRAGAQNLNNVRDISNVVPSLNFRTTASSKDQALFLRGMGTVSTSPGVEPTVSTVVDGVPLSRQGQANLDLLDVDHIEVLRGPQGTLFGKNASAGVVQFITRNPTSYFSGFTDLSYFDGEARLKAGVSGPVVSEKINALVSVLAATYDGNVTNVYNNDRVNGYTHKGARAKFEYVGSETTHVVVSVDYMDSHDTTPQGVVTQTFVRAYPTNVITNQPAFAAAMLPVVASATSREINSNYTSYADDTNFGLSAQLDHETATGYQWTSITAWRRWDNTQFQDQTRLPILTTSFPLQHDRGDLAFNQFSEEIRVASPKQGAIDYVAGAFFLRGHDDETYRRDTTRLISGLPQVDTGVANYGTTNSNYSLFGEMTVNFNSRFRGIAGLRLIHDNLDYNFNRVSTSAVAVPGIQVAFNSAGSTSKDGYAGRTGLQFDLTAKSNVYLTVSRGYKGPAYNVAFSMLPQDTGALRPETSVAYEAGWKSLILKDRASLNIAVFRDDFSDYQVNYFDTFNGSPITRLVNAGSVYTQGLEADLLVYPVKNVRLSVSVASTEARIEQFTIPAGAAASANINGQTMPFAPRFKASISGEYRIPLSKTQALTLSTNYNWRSQAQYSINQTPDTIQPAFGIWNAAMTWSIGSRLKISLLAKNITNQSYATNLSTFSGGVVRWVPRDDQRYFGLTLHKDF